MSNKTKAQLIDTILKNPVYLPSSGMYKQAANALSTLPRINLEQLQIITHLGRSKVFDNKRS